MEGGRWNKAFNLVSWYIIVKWYGTEMVGGTEIDYFVGERYKYGITYSVEATVWYEIQFMFT